MTAVSGCCRITVSDDNSSKDWNQGRNKILLFGSFNSSDDILHFHLFIYLFLCCCGRRETPNPDISMHSTISCKVVLQLVKTDFFESLPTNITWLEVASLETKITMLNFVFLSCLLIYIQLCPQTAFVQENSPYTFFFRF